MIRPVSVSDHQFSYLNPVLTYLGIYMIWVT